MSDGCERWMVDAGQEAVGEIGARRFAIGLVGGDGGSRARCDDHEERELVELALAGRRVLPLLLRRGGADMAAAVAIGIIGVDAVDGGDAIGEAGI